MIDTLRITSWKKSLISAGVQPLLSVIFCILYTYVILVFTGGKEFVGKASTYEVINGIRRDVVLVICVMMSSVIPILLLRYNSTKYLLAFIPLSILFYVAFTLITIIFIIDDNFDLINYVLISPVGSGIGTLVAIILNHIKNNNNIE